MRIVTAPVVATCAAALSAIILACERPSAPIAHVHEGALAAVIDDAAEAELRAMKSATSPFQDFATARAAGYDVQVTNCYENLPLGGMGYHWGDASRFDATLEVTKPEVLLYERGKGGSMTLVGVEYIVPFSAWTDPNPPQLFGQNFSRNLTFNVWALHAWVWRTNPRGVFADWNPRVHC